MNGKGRKTERNSKRKYTVKKKHEKRVWAGMERKRRKVMKERNKKEKAKEKKKDKWKKGKGIK